ncbi:hypothetical protein JQX13_20670 [Archangium violaceum]|uniref:EB domain-containing protein n=1 Tax=Archangium violaceum TaxID=83451 RepID=UPI00193B5782|nr:hypothetical protein [Archangium violaceum]QRK12236.1 hypothetical protein JQX13_20670 [Archangium violaceum]
MSIFPKYVVTALPALALVVLCAGCGEEVEPPQCQSGTHLEGTKCVPDVTQPPANACVPNPCTAPNKTVCSVSGGTAVCSCNAGYIPDGEGCREESAPDCARRHTLGDAFEPDECPSLAHPVSTSDMPESHTMSSGTDEDWSRFTAAEGRIYGVSVLGDSELRLRVDLYGADGTTLLASEAGSREGTELAYKARTAGELFARIRSADRSSSGAYQVSFSDLGTDDFADEPAQAVGVTLPGKMGSGALQFHGDVDVVRVRLEGGGHTYRFNSAWSWPTSGILRLELLGTDGASVLASGESTAPQFIFRVTTPGEYFLRLSETTGSRRASYDFSVVDLGVDDHANTPTQGTGISPSETFTDGELDYAEDEDVFTFEAQAHHVYQFECDSTAPTTPVTTRFPCRVSFVDTRGAVWRPGTTPAGKSAVGYEFDTASTVYVKLSSTAPFTDGVYKWRLRDLGGDDHGDTEDAATPVTASPTASTEGRFELPEDQDVLSFQAQAGHIYQFTCASDNATCNVSFLDADGSMLRSISAPPPPSDGTPAMRTAVLQYKFGKAGTYFVRLLGANPKSLTSQYHWTLMDQGVDDHGDSLASATAINPATTPTGATLEFVGDEDWFSFQAQATQTFRLSCDPSGRFDCNIYLMDDSGRLLASDTRSNQVGELFYRVATTGTYYMRISSGDGGIGDYSLQLQDLGVDDHSDTFTGATSLTLGAATAGKLQVSTDVDYFVVTLAASTEYSATVTADSSVVFTVYGPDRLSVLASGQGTKAFNSGDAGTYYVKVSFQTPRDVVTSYTVTVK